jgi:hypothetical protein
VCVTEYTICSFTVPSLSSHPARYVKHLVLAKRAFVCVCVCVCVCARACELARERERDRIGLCNSLVSCEGYITWVAFEWEGSTKVLGEKSVGRHFVHHGLNLDRTQACLVRC